MNRAEDFLTHLHGSYKGVAEITAALSEVLRANGIPHSPAQRDENELCLVCRRGMLACPGVHTFEEIQEANRVEWAHKKGDQ